MPDLKEVLAYIELKVAGAELAISDLEDQIDANQEFLDLKDIEEVNKFDFRGLEHWNNELRHMLVVRGILKELIKK